MFGEEITDPAVSGDCCDVCVERERPNQCNMKISGRAKNSH